MNPRHRKVGVQLQGLSFGWINPGRVNWGSSILAWQHHYFQLPQSSNQLGFNPELTRPGGQPGKAEAPRLRWKSTEMASFGDMGGFSRDKMVDIVEIFYVGIDIFIGNLWINPQKVNKGVPDFWRNLCASQDCHSREVKHVKNSPALGLPSGMNIYHF